MFCCSLQQVDIQMRHCFSAEIDPAKRKFIVDAHVPQGEKPMVHLFKDVAAFVNGQGECATCNDQIHESSQDIDVLFAGVSCKSLSCCNTQRQIRQLLSNRRGKQRVYLSAGLCGACGELLTGSSIF